MPYTTINWVKLKLELLADYRFTDECDDGEKLIYMGLLLLAGQTQNKIPNNPRWIKRMLNLQLSEDEIRMKIKRLLEIFQGFNGNSQILNFKNFNRLHHWVGSSKGTVDRTPDKIREDIREDIRIEKIYNHWSSLNIYKHKLPEPHYIQIYKTLKAGYTEEEIKQAISNYSYILRGHYRWTYRWTLSEFLKRGIERFMDLETAKQNFRDKGTEDEEVKRDIKDIEEKM